MTDHKKLPPVLLLAFNRADTTALVIESLRRVRPAELYFAVDGARPARPAEEERVRQVRDLVRSIDWPCRVETLFRDANLGCKRAVSGAITWFFDHVEAGVILEDDCIADPSFFSFAAELLERFREDERVMVISGDNFQFGRQRTSYSYYYSRYTHIWGWATWRRAWKQFDYGMERWPELRDGNWLEDLLGDRRQVRYWKAIFDETHADLNTSWAYRWTYSVWLNSGLTVLPNANLVSNIGFGRDATNNWRRSSRFAALPSIPMAFPLRHPPIMIPDAVADRFTQRHLFSRPLWRSLARRTYKLFRPA